MIFMNMYALGTQVSLISDVFRNLSFYLDVVIYSLIPFVYSMIFSLYDISLLFRDQSVLTNLVNRMTTTIYSFIAIFMFFRVAFSLITMLVDPSTIDDKEKGAKKVVMNIMICLILIVVVPKIFQYAKEIQTKAMTEHWIEKVVLGDDFADGNKNYSLGNELALSVWGVFFAPFDTNSVTQAAYDSVFNNPSATEFNAVWPVVKLHAVLNSVVGIPVIADVIGRVDIFNNILNIFDAGTYYQLSYIYILSTIVGVYVLWTFIKMMIDVAYRSIKFFALELLSPIAIMSYIDPSSSKKGIFSKWLNETVKTYISLFVRVFIFAFASILLRTLALSDLDLGNGIFTNLIYILAVIAFIKTAPKFIDNLFGTSISKDSDTKFVSDMFRGILGGVTTAAVGAISGGYVANKTGHNVLKGTLSGGWKGFSKGYNSAKKGDMIGVVKGGYDSYQQAKKSYGYDYDTEEERDLKAMEQYVASGKTAKNKAIANAESNNRQAIKEEFGRVGKKPRKVNGYDVKYNNLIGNADAEGAYKKYVAVVAENSAIPGISEEGLNIYNNAAQRKMYAALSKIQAAGANDTFNVEYSAFVQRDTAGRERALIEAFDAENRRLQAEGKSTYSDWQTMFKDMGGLDASATISVDSAYKIALDNRIKVETGHTTSEWANIAAKDEADASAAADEVKRHEASSKGKADKRRKDLYAKAKGKVEAQGYTP